MAFNPLNTPGAVAIDANGVIAISSREAGRDAKATAELTRYASLGYEWYAPGTIISETLYILCGKFAAGILSPSDYALAVQTFERTMKSILPPPSGDKSLIARAQQIGAGYGCSHSADGIYIALAEELALTRPAVLLTFDQGLARQAAKNAPTVIVKLLS